MDRRCVCRFGVVITALAHLGLCVRPEGYSAHLHMVASEANAPACGLAAFSTIGATATSGEFKTVFQDKCETVYPVGVCTAAISELWEGQDTSAKLASPRSAFCAKLRRVVDVAQRSALVGQDVDVTGLNAAVLRKVKSATDEDLNDGDLDDAEDEDDTVSAHHSTIDRVCVKDDEFYEVCAIVGADSCGLGDTAASPADCKRAADLILAKQGRKRNWFKAKKWLMNKPVGCSVKSSNRNGNQVYFNENDIGKNGGSFQLICVAPTQMGSSIPHDWMS